jgi:branched-chain amino acid transport system permease protein
MATGWAAGGPEINMNNELHVSHALGRYRLRWSELLWWLLAVATFFCFPGYLSFGSSVLIMALYAMSLGLILGFTGIISLGHAMFFGIGAYAAGLLALAGWSEPVSGAVLGGIVAALVGVMIGPLILRLTGMPLFMVTLSLGVVAFEAANKAGSITGGDDGMLGIVIAPLFGHFEWTVDGQTQYLYVLGWLFVLFCMMRWLLASPYGLALEGVRENTLRMNLIGAPVLRYRVIAYVISAFIAGLAGALSAQTTAFVGLHVLSIEMSVDGLLMLVIGGVGHLYGGLVGAPLYMSVKYFSQQWNPFYWMFFVGALLILVTRFAKGGVIGLAGRALDILRRRKGN